MNSHANAALIRRTCRLRRKPTSEREAPSYEGPLLVFRLYAAQGLLSICCGVFLRRIFGGPARSDFSSFLVSRFRTRPVPSRVAMGPPFVSVGVGRGELLEVGARPADTATQTLAPVPTDRSRRPDRIRRAAAPPARPLIACQMRSAEISDLAQLHDAATALLPVLNVARSPWRGSMATIEEAEIVFRGDERRGRDGRLSCPSGCGSASALLGQS
jgi:hypothetical protein